MHIVTPEQSAAPAVDAYNTKSEGREYLVFGLGGEEYAVDTHYVRELRSYEMVTQLANAPDYIKGVINLRGLIVPILDMRLKLGLGTPTYDAFTVMIILNTGSGVIGIVVDSVSDVATLAPEHIKSAPVMNDTAVNDWLLGLGTINDRMLIVVDIDKFVSAPELDMVTPLAA